MFDKKVEVAGKTYLFGKSVTVMKCANRSGFRGSSLTQEKTHVKTYRVDIPFSFVYGALLGLSKTV